MVVFSFETANNVLVPFNKYNNQIYEIVGVLATREVGRKFNARSGKREKTPMICIAFLPKARQINYYNQRLVDPEIG